MDTLTETLRDALAAFVGFLPDLVAGLLVLLVGWVVAILLRRVVRALLPRAGFDRFLARHEVIDRAPETHAGSNVVASATFWAIMLIAFMQAANIWHLEFVANGLGRVIAYVPNIVAAALVLGLALVVGNWVRGRLASRGAESRWQSTILPGALRAAIITLGAFLALRQLQIAPELLVITFALVFGAIAVAAALALGLGGRHTVERMTRDWYERQRTARSSDEPGRREVPPGQPRVS